MLPGVGFRASRFSPSSGSVVWASACFRHWEEAGMCLQRFLLHHTR